MSEKIKRAAKTAHEVNRAYCEGLGDLSQVPWDAAPDWQRQSAIAGVQAIADNPSTTSAQSHEGWLEVKRADGWKYGHTKDAALKEHPCFVPYDQLPAAQRYKDTLFGATVRGVLGL